MAVSMSARLKTKSAATAMAELRFFKGVRSPTKIIRVAARKRRASTANISSKAVSSLLWDWKMPIKLMAVRQTPTIPAETAKSVIKCV